MRYKAGHKEEARQRMLAAAGRGFRRKGFGGIGVDGLAKEAQVTSGAFYGHFASKEAAFGDAVEAGIEELRLGVEAIRKSHGNRWLEAFVDYYLTQKRTCDLGESCAAQSLSSEVTRAGGEVRERYQQAMSQVMTCIADGLETGTAAERAERAWALMALLTGAVTIARAVVDPATASAIVAGARQAALTIAGQGSG